MRRNISANIVSIGSMRIAEVREEVREDGAEVEWLSSGPFHLSKDDDRGENRLFP